MAYRLRRLPCSHWQIQRAGLTMWQKRLFSACLLALFLLPAASFLAAESPSPSIAQLLKQADATLTTLELRLKERKQEVLNLQADLMTLSAQLKEARGLLEESQADLTETRTLLNQLTTRYDKLLSDWKTSVRKTKIELWIWRVVSAAALVGLVSVAVSK